MNLSAPSGQAKPVTKVTQSVRPGQARGGLAGRGRPVAQGQAVIRVQQQPIAPEIKKEHPAAQSSTTPEVILCSKIHHTPMM